MHMHILLLFAPIIHIRPAKANLPSSATVNVTGAEDHANIKAILAASSIPRDVITEYPLLDPGISRSSPASKTSLTSPIPHSSDLVEAWSTPTPGPLLSAPADTSTPSPSQIVSVYDTEADKDSTEPCWASKECNEAMLPFARCYEQVGLVTDPNSSTDQSWKYRECICTKDIRSIAVTSSLPLTSCIACLAQAGLNTNDPSSPLSLLPTKLSAFCNTANPNEYDLLRALVHFGIAAKVPSSFTVIPPAIATITALEGRFRSEAGMNVPSVTTATTTRMSEGASISSGTGQTTAAAAEVAGSQIDADNGVWWNRTLTFGDTIPTEYFEQVPRDWPYTAYGVRRELGSLAKWPLTHANSSTRTVGWVYHRVKGNGRPLATPPAVRTSSANEKATERYDPALEDWTRTFTYSSLTHRGGGSGPESPTTSPSTTAGKSDVQPSQSQFQPSHSLSSIPSSPSSTLIPPSTPTTTTTTASAVTSQTRTKPTPPWPSRPSLPPPPLLPFPGSTPGVKPSITQLPIHSKDPDQNDVKISLMSTSSHAQ